MHEHPDVVNLMPPGTYLEVLEHPSGDSSESVEMAIFKEHRFAFYFWNRWTNKLTGQSAPTLITVDWHRDLAPPSGNEKRALEHLDLSNEDKVSEFIWSELNTHNDSHLLSAGYLNIIGDIILLKNYGDPSEDEYRDSFGNRHCIREFKRYKNFENAVIADKSKQVYLDLDLDFFIKGKVYSHQTEEVTPYSRDEIAGIINPESLLFKHLFRKLEGITIATEPRYCGGILKSHSILEGVLQQLLTDEMKWKHLAQRDTR